MNESKTPTPLHVEDEMIPVHIDGEYAYTLYFPSPPHARAFFERWQKLETELAESQAREVKFRLALVTIKEYWNHASESAVDAIETAEGLAEDALTLTEPQRVATGTAHDYIQSVCHEEKITTPFVIQRNYPEENLTEALN